MKKYTQADFDALVRDKCGWLHIPSGDWTEVNFDGRDALVFGDYCTLGNWCKLGNWCTLGDGCTLGNWCTLGNRCTLGNGCTLEGGRVENATFFFASNIGSVSRTAYAYCNTKTGEIFIRAGCWFSDLPAFIERAKSVHGGTRHEVDYLAFAEFAKARFARYGKEVREDD